MTKTKAIWLGIGYVLIFALFFGSYWYSKELEPLAPGPLTYERVSRRSSLDAVLRTLQQKGYIRSANGLAFLARIQNRSRLVAEGTYQFRAGMTANEIFAALEKPVRQMVRLPETNWAQRNANLLEKAGVCSSKDYMKQVRNPQEFQDKVPFPLPKTSLEGYLYPDTYDLPPKMGAEAVILRQLKNFEKRVWNGLGQPRDLDTVLRKASLVELEVARDEERAVVAGVIENRLATGMRLQIDASINYGIQKWRPLKRREYQDIKSPYNLYLVDGLPPTPICNPTVKSIQAVLKPAKHNYLYYVAMPSGESRFAASIEEHDANFKARKAAQRALKASQSSERDAS